MRPSPQYSMRVVVRPGEGGPSALRAAVASLGGEVKLLQADGGESELVFYAPTLETAEAIVDRLRALPGAEVVEAADRVFELHERGKISIACDSPLLDTDALSMAYTPGVARVSLAVAEDPSLARRYTIKCRTVAVLSDGSAVLGLGDIGPLGALPVMEGKAMLFKTFGGVDAFPICVATKDVEEIVRTAELIAPVFGGINLEDISAPRCFDVERELQARVDIPVFHDDQHGTAVVVLAALLSALKVVGKRMEDLKLVISGGGAAGIACARMLMSAGVVNVICCDRVGALYPGRRENMNPWKERLAEETNPEGERGALKEVIRGADVFLGVSAPNILEESDVAAMAPGAIVFALSNPTPEVPYEVAVKHAAVVATGRSDYPNQINNVLCFPGLFRGALEAGAHRVTEEMKLAAAHAIASCVGEEELAQGRIIPSVFDPRVAPAVAEAVAQAARASGAVA